MLRNVAFTRLSTIEPQAIAAHMSDPRVTEHMPLATGSWTQTTAREFIAAKEAYWARDGLGHWAFLHDGQYVGWGGFQKEGDEWDYGLVLTAEAFGLGRCITQKALSFARIDERIPYVTFLLPPTRKNLGALERLGARFSGQVTYEGETFLQYRLKTEPGEVV